jgi:hypothetical protein
VNYASASNKQFAQIENYNRTARITNVSLRLGYDHDGVSDISPQKIIYNSGPGSGLHTLETNEYP